MCRVLLVVSTVFEANSIIERWGAAAPLALPLVGWPVVDLDAGARLVISGVGKANAAAATMWAIDGVSCVMNLGICGTLPGSPAQIGDVVLGTETVFGDEGVGLGGGLGVGFRSCAELGFGVFARLGKDRLAAPERVVRALNGVRGYRGTIATVSECSGSDARANSMVQRTGAIAEGMEGAAVALVADRMAVPWCEARIVSNTTGDREKQVWDAKGAAEGLGALARETVMLLDREFVTGPDGSKRAKG